MAGTHRLVGAGFIVVLHLLFAILYNKRGVEFTGSPCEFAVNNCNNNCNNTKNRKELIMLRELVEKKHTIFADKARGWQEAIRMSCTPFVADGTAEEGYAEEVIRCIEQYGPYIVLIPGVAMPHSQENGPLVHGTGVSFMRLKEPVCFDPEDEDKWADLFFAIAANDPEAHLENIKGLMEIFQNEELLDKLRAATCDEDLLALSEQYEV